MVSSMTAKLIFDFHLQQIDPEGLIKQKNFRRLCVSIVVIKTSSHYFSGFSVGHFIFITRYEAGNEQIEEDPFHGVLLTLISRLG